MSFLKSLKFTNFQSHKETIFNFNSGFNVIVGLNDVGKTSALRSLLSLAIPKTSGKEDIRKGEKKYSIEGVFSNDVKIIRERNKKTTIYYLYNGKNKEKFSGMGKELPNKIKKAIRMNRINFQFPFDGPFLIAKSKPARTRYLNEELNTGLQDKAKTINKKELTDLKKKYSFIKTEFKNVKKKLKKIIDTTEAEVILNTLKITITNIKSSNKKIEYLEKLIQKSIKLKKQKKDIQKINDVLSLINKIFFEKEKIKEVNKQISKVKNFYSELKYLKEKKQEVKIETNRTKEYYRKNFPDTCPLCEQPIKNGVDLK